MRQESDILIVRTPQGWWSAPTTDGHVMKLSLAEVLELVGAAPSIAPIMHADEGDHQPPSLAPGSTLHPTMGWAARVARGSLVAEHRNADIALDRRDLALLDTVDGPTSLDAFVEADREDAPRLARLVQLHLLRVEPRVGAPTAPMPSPATEPTAADPESRSGSWLGRIRQLRSVPDQPGSATASIDPDAQPASSPAVSSPPMPVHKIVAPRGAPAPGGPAGRVPVYAPWHELVGPGLALGMLTAAARHHADGRLNTSFEIRRPESAESMLEDLATRTGPAVVLCSNYVWSIDANLELARRAVAMNPQVVVIHGGPSTPKYEADAEAFLAEHGEIAHVLARGEGEHLFVELLSALEGHLDRLPGRRLSKVGGITYTDPLSGDVVRTPDRERIAELDLLPSPYLTGEFDHIPGSAWNATLAVETNRGCPYKCTYCDWGSVTQSRIRKFDLDRIRSEIIWASERGVNVFQITDANFGIMSRDVDVAAAIVDAHRTLGYPQAVTFCPSKNTSRHLPRIMDIFQAGDVSAVAALGVQTTDPTVLEAIERSNISVESYVALAAENRRRGHALQGELLLGLPEQTYDSYKTDLQFMLDHEILVRTWPVQLLPNAPMNEPGYRESHGIVVDERSVVMSTATFTSDDRARMLELRRAQMTLETWGLARHVLRWVQWDAGVLAMELVDHLVTITQRTPERVPALAWTLANFEFLPVAPVSWRRFFDDLRLVLSEDFGIVRSSALDAAMAVNEFLLPAPGRTFPATIELEHDYVAYYRDATRLLYSTGEAAAPRRLLSEHPPAVLSIDADPLGLCDDGLVFLGESGDQIIQSDFYMATNSAYELLSPLTRLLPHIVRRLTPEQSGALIAAALDATVVPDTPARDGAATPVSVTVGRSVVA